jgi:hypothetical protein
MTKFNQYCKENNFIINEIAGDGHCLLSACLSLYNKTVKKELISTDLIKLINDYVDSNYNKLRESSSEDDLNVNMRF